RVEQQAEPRHRQAVSAGRRAVRAVPPRRGGDPVAFLPRRCRQRRPLANGLEELLVVLRRTPDGADAVLEARELYRFYHAGAEETFALRGVSLLARSGEMVAVVGPSGSGKSTLLSCLAGLDEPDAGTVFVAGHRITRRPEADRAALRASWIGVLLQSGNLIEHLTVRQNVRAAQALSTGRTRQPVDALLQMTGLLHRASAEPSALSGGEAARAGLAVALANDPPVLLADEPTGEVDRENEARILDLLRARSTAGGTVVVVSHSDRVAAPLVRAETVGIAYGSGSARVTAVEEATFEIEPGERVALVGPSGSGKTSLLHLMAGLERPTSGTITWPAIGPIQSLRPGAAAIAFQGPSLLPPLTVLENVALPLLLGGYPEPQARRAAAAAMERLEISELAEKLPEELSGGQLQRAGLARALVDDPRLVLADEPTGQQDRASAERVMEVLLEVTEASGAALVVATHDLLVAERLSERWEMESGRLDTGQRQCSF